MIAGRRASTSVFVACITGSFLALCCGASPPGETVTPESENGLVEPPPPRSIGDLAAEAEQKPTASMPDDPRPGCDMDVALPSDVSPTADLKTLHELGQQRILDRDGPAALAILLAANREAPDDPAVLGDLATALLQCRIYSEAVTRAERATDLDPQNVDLLANLAQTYQIVGRNLEAVETYRRAIELSPKDAAAHNNLAVAQIVVRDFEAAEKAMRAAISIDPENTNYWVNLGYVLYRQQRLPDAEMVLKTAIEKDPRSAAAHNQLGLVYAAQRRNSVARDEFLEAVKIDPEHRAARENLQAMDDGFDFSGPWEH